MRKWRSAVVTAAWVAVGTAAGALGAWQLAGADADDGAHSSPLDEAAVRRALASAPETAPGTATSPGTGTSPGTRSPSPSASPSPTPERSTVRFTGGAATVECRPDGTAYLVSWSPANGFHIDEDVTRGPSSVTRLEAEPDEDDDQDDLPYEITCTQDGPRARLAADTDDD